MGSLSKDLSGEVMGSDGLFIAKDTLENRLKRGREEAGNPGVSAVVEVREDGRLAWPGMSWEVVRHGLYLEGRGRTG